MDYKAIEVKIANTLFLFYEMLNKHFIKYYISYSFYDRSVLNFVVLISQYTLDRYEKHSMCSYIRGGVISTANTGSFRFFAVTRIFISEKEW